MITLIPGVDVSKIFIPKQPFSTSLVSSNSVEDQKDPVLSTVPALRPVDVKTVIVDSSTGKIEPIAGKKISHETRENTIFMTPSQDR